MATALAELRTSTREEMIECHLPLARRLARRYARSSDSYEELVQVASLALVHAVDRFDPEVGSSFDAFAIPTIMGELKRHLRDTRWALHVPRELQERAQAVAAQRDRLTVVLRRVPTIAEVADSLGLDIEETIRASAALNGLDALSLDAPAAGDTTADEALIDWVGDVEHGYETVEDLEALAPAMARLPRRDRMVLRLRFLDDMTQAEIADVLGVSQMHVSRILRRSIEKLRRHTSS
jgi:RNA polymerase sigma-B factor